MNGWYEWRGGREAVLRFGDDAAPVVVLASPPFEEANRVRALIVTIARMLAERRLAVVIPDLPGMGESLVDIAAVRLADWREALAAASASSGRVRIVASIRAGALYDGDPGAAGHWRLAPQTGDRLVRELMRARLAGLREDGRDATLAALTESAERDGIELSGHWLMPDLFRDLAGAEPDTVSRVRTLRLASDTQAAERHVDIPPLWRRAEPDNDVASARLLADDIAQWTRSCLGK